MGYHLQAAPLERAGFEDKSYETLGNANTFYLYGITEARKEILIKEMALKSEPKFIRFHQVRGARSHMATLRAFDENAVEIGEVYNGTAIDTVKKVRDCKK